MQTTARRLWDAMASGICEIMEQGDVQGNPIEMLRTFADMEGGTVFDRMVRMEQERQLRQQTVRDSSIDARLNQLKKAGDPEWEYLRRRQIESTLPTNRNQREQDFYAPQLRCLCVLKVDVE